MLSDKSKYARLSLSVILRLEKTVSSDLAVKLNLSQHAKRNKTVLRRLLVLSFHFEAGSRWQCLFMQAQSSVAILSKA